MEPDQRTGGLDSPTHSEMLLVEMARMERTLAAAQALGTGGQSLGRGEEFSRRLGSGQTTRVAPGAQQRNPTPVRVSPAIRSCGSIMPLRSTAGCGKPHVRWCGRVTGAQSPALDPIRIGCPTRRHCSFMTVTKLRRFSIK